jgi:K+-transporting ATPase ATPase C chain
MFKHISKSLLLLLFAVIICCVIYPAVVWSIGQSLFPFQANGSMMGPDGKPMAHPDDTAVGSLLIAQPFTKDEYFQPRPSACNYDASASSSQAWAASNYQLRNRVAAQLGPIVTYKSGPTANQPVAPDIEAWFQKDQFAGSPSIVAQWADAHNGLAQGWVLASGSTYDPKNPTPQQQYVLDWAKAHPAVVAKFKNDNPTIADPQPADLAVVFFETFSKENPGKFPSLVTPPAPATAPSASVAQTAPTSAPAQVMMAVNAGSDIQSFFFDMWRQDHPDADLQDLPGDLVTTSGSGLDPHITLQNAEYQLDRVSAKWAADLKRDPPAVRTEIDQILQNDAAAPFSGLAGEKIINVLQVNLELKQKYGSPS